MKPVSLFFIILTCGFTKILFSQMPGDLDTTFGGDGKVITAISPFDDRLFSMAIQSDGKIVGVGKSNNGTWDQFAITRYMSDGGLDTSFGTDGIVTTAVSSYHAWAFSAAIQSDGKIIAVGFYYTAYDPNYLQDFALVRYNIDGSLDTSFGGDGIVTTNFNPFAVNQGRSVAIQSDGKIVAVGYTWNGDYGDFALARYNTNGSLDISFGTDGKVITDFGSNDGAYSVAIAPDGKIIATGYSIPAFGASYDWALSRYNSDGSLDNSFSIDGKIITHIPPDTREAYVGIIQPDGKILAGGGSGIDADGDMDFAIGRYNISGSMDTTFGDIGIVKTHVSDYWDYTQSLAMQPDGSIIALGYTGNVDYSDFALVRYKSDGNLDTTFSIDGKITTDFYSGYDLGYSVALQLDGKIVAAGCSFNGTDNDFVLARYFSGIIIPCDSLITHPNSVITNIGTDTIFWVSASGDSINYQWQSDFVGVWGNVIDGGQYSGTTNDTLTVSNVIMSNDNQIFRCLISNKDCADTSNVAILNVLATNEIYNSINDNSINIYPNPANDKIILTINNPFNINSSSNISICDLSGKNILQLKIKSSETEIDVSQFVAGIYFVKVILDEHHFVRKLIIE